MDNEEKLLATVREWWSDYKYSHRHMAEKENVFDILEVSHKEVIMCRMLADLIGNTVRHVNAKRNLAWFLKFVLKLQGSELPEGFAENAYIKKEYLIPGTDRRIDLAIYTADYFIPIEVKIYADDQESQCYDYYQYAKAWNEDSGRKTRIYYLTLDGKSPSKASLSKVVDGQVCCIGEQSYRNISWRKDIVSWLQIILKEMDTGIQKALTEQYLEAIEEMSGKAEQDKKNEMVQIITQDAETFRAASLIGDYVTAAKSANAEIFMRDMQTAMVPVALEYHLKLSDSDIYPCTDFTFKEPRYLKYNVTRPGLDHKYAPVQLMLNRYLWFVIEIYWRLDVGFVVFDSESNLIAEDTLGFKEYAEEYLKTANARHAYEGGRCLIWDYLNTQQDAPNFAEPNNLAIQMIDPKARAEFIAEYIKKIRCYLDKHLRGIAEITSDAH